MKFFFLFSIALLLHSCTLFSHKPYNDLEAIAEDVLRAKQGVEIIVQPTSK